MHNCVQDFQTFRQPCQVSVSWLLNFAPEIEIASASNKALGLDRLEHDYLTGFQCIISAPNCKPVEQHCALAKFFEFDSLSTYVFTNWIKFSCSIWINKIARIQMREELFFQWLHIGHRLCDYRVFFFVSSALHFSHYKWRLIVFTFPSTWLVNKILKPNQIEGNVK